MQVIPRKLHFANTIRNEHVLERRSIFMKENENIRNLSGLGEKRASLLNKKHIYTINDLLRFYPREYEINPPATKSFYDALRTGQPLVAVVAGGFKKENKNGKEMTKCWFKDANGVRFYCMWFTPMKPQLLNNGRLLILKGKCEIKDNNFLMMVHPLVYDVVEYRKMVNVPLPVYSLTEGLSNYIVVNAVKDALEKCAINETLPEEIIKEKNLPPLKEILRMIHFPESEEDIKKADEYLAYEEMFIFFYKLKAANKTRIQNKYSFPKGSDTKKVCDSLPFELTKGQLRAIGSIYRDLNSPYISSRLIQGDVGCGKTLVALINLIYVVENGYQATLMAPTEVLARQHYNEALKLISNAGIDLKVCILTSETTKKDKEKIIASLKDGEPMLLIGTHAILSIADEFTKLAFVIIDEQHKFGVAQREALLKHNPHFVTMTATPIPRSLGLAIYGNDSVSEIMELPKGRLAIKNCVINDKKLSEVYNFVNKQIALGHQAYVVCPAIEENEEIPMYNVSKATELFKKALPNAKIGYIHGKTSKAEKENTMIAYINGELDVLISTTVIEVGVNVPNATTMAILNAERFGLATLHQLRGRIGRGSYQSYCIFVDCLESEASKDRMTTISSSNDGFKIAEADLVLRGPGELLGTEQSGRWNFKKADIADEEMVKKVMTDVMKVS